MRAKLPGLWCVGALVRLMKISSRRDRGFVWKRRKENATHEGSARSGATYPNLELALVVRYLGYMPFARMGRGAFWEGANVAATLTIRRPPLPAASAASGDTFFSFSL